MKKIIWKILIFILLTLWIYFVSYWANALVITESLKSYATEQIIVSNETDTENWNPYNLDKNIYYRINVMKLRQELGL